MGMTATIRTHLPLVFIGLLAILLMGYVVGGRGFAHHTGIHPVYLSEIALLVGIAIIILGFRALRIESTMLLLIAYVGLTGLHVIASVGEYGIDAIRDGMIGIYGIFAISVALVLRFRHLPRIARSYRVLIPLVLIWTPIAAIIRRSYQDLVPAFSSTGVDILYFKAGDFAVHLTGIAGFIILGIYSSRTGRIGRWWLIPLWALWAIAVFVVLNSRAATLTVQFGVLTAQLLMFLRPGTGTARYPMLLLPWLMITLLLTVTTITGMQFQTASGDVRIDGRYVLNGLTSMVGITFIGDPRSDQTPAITESTAEQPVEHALDQERTEPQRSVEFDRTSQRQLNTREWRIEWWRSIVDYTVRGDYFWTGKGVGVNLADSDGFQVDQDPPLRSPHNIHLTILARMGVPGLVIWAALQISFALAVMRVFMRESRHDTQGWVRLTAGAVLVYWVAIMVNSTFDVYLEGPQGGIWYWVIFGVGLAVIQWDRQLSTDRQPSSAP
jgi:hypothetical protein